MPTIAEQAGIAGRLIDLHGELWQTEPPRPDGGQAKARAACCPSCAGYDKWVCSSCARYDKWVYGMGGYASRRYTELCAEARATAGPGGEQRYLDMAMEADEEHATGAGKWLAEVRGAGRVIDLVGPKGYIHGWIFVGIPAPGAEVFHPRHGHGTVTAVRGGHVSVAFDAGHSASFPVRSHSGPGHFERMTDDELAGELSAGQGSRFQSAVDEMDRRDRQAKAGRVNALFAENPKSEADRSRVYQGLVNEGVDPGEAWAHAHSTSADDMQKQAVMQQLRAEGHKGAGFDALTRAAYKDEVRRRTVAAEAATNGYMLSPAGERAGVDPYSLFTGPESRARKYASPELKEWFDQNGRPTAADFQANLMGKPVPAGPRGGDFYAAVTRDDIASAIEMAGEAAIEACLQRVTEAKLAVDQLREDPRVAQILDADLPGPRLTAAEVGLELRASMGLATRPPTSYEAGMPPVADLARTIGLRP